MADMRRWVAATAASVLGVGVIATSAITVANAMPLVESTRVADVPPISTVPGEQKGSPAVVPGGSGEAPASAVSPSTEPAPVPAPQPVAPRPAVTDSAPSAPSVASPAGDD